METTKDTATFCNIWSSCTHVQPSGCWMEASRPNAANDKQLGTICIMAWHEVCCTHRVPKANIGYEHPCFWEFGWFGVLSNEWECRKHRKVCLRKHNNLIMDWGPFASCKRQHFSATIEIKTSTYQTQYSNTVVPSTTGVLTQVRMCSHCGAHKRRNVSTSQLQNHLSADFRYLCAALTENI